MDNSSILVSQDQRVKEEMNLKKEGDKSILIYVCSYYRTPVMFCHCFGVFLDCQIFIAKPN